MKRRGRRHADTMSLFAFQDVMASLIGILFFVVLLMALDITSRDAPAGESTPDSPELADLAALQAKINGLRAEKKRLEEYSRTMVSKIDLASSMSDHQIVKSIKELNERLSHLAKRIEQEETSLALITEGLRKSRGDIAGQTTELAQLRADLAKLKELQEQTKKAQTAPRVTYLIDHSLDLTPWLVEVTGKTIRVSSRKGTNTVEFSAKSFAARKRLFLEWTKNKSPKTDYFVLLVKPSGMEHLGLSDDIKKRGFQQGLDLLPEDWEPFE